MPACRALKISTRTFFDKKELINTIKRFPLEVRTGDVLQYEVQGKEVPVKFKKVSPSPCTISESTEIEIELPAKPSKKVEERTYGRFRQMAVKSGCTPLEEFGAEGTFFCGGYIVHAKAEGEVLKVNKIDQAEVELL